MTRAYNQYQQKNAAKDQEKEDTRFADSVRAISYTHLRNQRNSCDYQETYQTGNYGDFPDRKYSEGRFKSN